MNSFDLGKSGKHEVAGVGDGVAVPFEQRALRGGGMNVDASVNAVATTGLVLLMTIAANPDRRWFRIQNNAAGQIVAELTDGLGGTPTRYVVQAARTLDYNDAPHLGQIDLDGAADASIAAAEW
jgi:hypothetical protein